MKIHPQAYGFFFSFCLIGALIFIFAPELRIITYVCAFLALFTLFFFRDPVRKLPEGEKRILSPADGTILQIVPVKRDEQPYYLVSIFMSIFNVHINRVPVTGKVTDIRYNPGAFLPAFHNKASARNEQSEITIAAAQGPVIVFRQIAGLIARRIICRLDIGQQVTAGERFGMIRFGSRVDIYLPAGCTIHVKKGDSVRGGSSILGELP